MLNILQFKPSIQFMIGLALIKIQRNFIWTRSYRMEKHNGFEVNRNLAP